MIGAPIVRPLSDLTEHSRDFFAELQESDAPILLTVEGEGRLIVQNPRSYQKMLVLIERFETIQAVRQGLAEAARGEGRSMEEAFDELKAELRALGDS